MSSLVHYAADFELLESEVLSKFLSYTLYSLHFQLFFVCTLFLSIKHIFLHYPADISCWKAKLWISSSTWHLLFISRYFIVSQSQ